MVGVATYNGHAYCRTKFIDKLKTISKGCEVVVVWNSSWKEGKRGIKDYEDAGFNVINLSTNNETGVELLARKQNIIREKFLKSDCTHLLMLESDNIPPDNVVERLLSHDVDVVCGLYFAMATKTMVRGASPTVKAEGRKQGMNFDSTLIIKQTPIPIVWGIFNCELFENKADKTTQSVRFWSVEDYIDHKQKGHSLVPIFGSGVGCVLFNRDAMSNISFRVSKSSAPDGRSNLTDFTWYRDAFLQGITCYCDIDCLVQHYHTSELEGMGNFRKWFDPVTMEKKDEIRPKQV